MAPRWLTAENPTARRLSALLRAYPPVRNSPTWCVTPWFAAASATAAGPKFEEDCVSMVCVTARSRAASVAIEIANTEAWVIDDESDPVDPKRLRNGVTLR